MSRVEVSIDGRPFRAARLQRQLSGARAQLAVLDLRLGHPDAGEHTVTSRAYDAAGNVQPRPDDPFLASRRTFWEANGQITRRVRTA